MTSTYDPDSNAATIGSAWASSPLGSPERPWYRCDVPEDPAGRTPNPMIRRALLGAALAGGVTAAAGLALMFLGTGHAPQTTSVVPGVVSSNDAPAAPAVGGPNGTTSQPGTDPGLPGPTAVTAGPGIAETDTGRPNGTVVTGGPLAPPPQAPQPQAPGAPQPPAPEAPQAPSPQVPQAPQVPLPKLTPPTVKLTPPPQQPKLTLPTVKLTPQPPQPKLTPPTVTLTPQPPNPKVVIGGVQLNPQPEPPSPLKPPLVDINPTVKPGL